MAVYAIRCGEHGPVKLGKADDPQERLAALQTAHWETLVLLRTWRGGESEEALLHVRFADLHIRGEWFHFSRQMLGDVGLQLLYEAQPVSLTPATNGKYGSVNRPEAKYDDGLRRALNAVGGPSKLAALLNVVPSAVTQWSRIPAKHVPRVSALTEIDGRELRPDLYVPVAEARGAV